MGKIKKAAKGMSTLDWISVALATPISAALDPMRPLNKITELTTPQLDKPDKPPSLAVPELLPVPEKEKRKKSGRQSTILTSALSDSPTSSPTLLGQ